MIAHNTCLVAVQVAVHRTEGFATLGFGQKGLELARREALSRLHISHCSAVICEQLAGITCGHSAGYVGNVQSIKGLCLRSICLLHG